GGIKMNKKIVAFAAFLVLLVGVGYAVTDAETLKKQKFNPISSYHEIAKSKSNLIEYKNKVEEKLKELNNEASSEKEVFVTLTFTKPLNEGELANLVSKYNIKVDQIKGRAIEKGTGLKATFGLKPVEGQLIDKIALENILSQNEAVFKGFIEAVVVIKNKDLQELKNEKLVYLADPSADEHFVSNPKHDSMPGVYWELEKYNLVAN
ncbi:MAG: hypothetical protein C0P72_010450, partial [Clostridia bacterium]